MILDTCILIEILKGNEKIVEFSKTYEGDLFVSDVSQMELYFGAVNKKENKMPLFTLNLKDFSLSLVRYRSGK